MLQNGRGADVVPCLSTRGAVLCKNSLKTCRLQLSLCAMVIMQIHTMNQKTTVYFLKLTTNCKIRYNGEFSYKYYYLWK